MYELIFKGNGATNECYHKGCRSRPLQVEKETSVKARNQSVRVFNRDFKAENVII